MDGSAEIFIFNGPQSIHSLRSSHTATTAIENIQSLSNGKNKVLTVRHFLLQSLPTTAIEEGEKVILFISAKKYLDV